MKTKKGVVVYKYKNNLYINLTNRCCVKCSYCIKYKWNKIFRGYNLGLNHEPEITEIKNAIKKKLSSDIRIKEVVFCGYGEPLLRWETVKEVSLWIKQNFPKYKIRVNTNGLAAAYTKTNICKELSSVVDSISVSLNAHDEKSYLKLHKTSIKQPFKKILNFIKQAKKYIPEVTVTTIKHPQINIVKVKNIVNKLKVKFKVRKYF